MVGAKNVPSGRGFISLPPDIWHKLPRFLVVSCNVVVLRLSNPRAQEPFDASGTTTACGPSRMQRRQHRKWGQSRLIRQASEN